MSIINRNNGDFVISLDFEIHWGVYDALSLKEYQQNLLAVPQVIDRLLNMAEKYDVKLTFATVGFLFAESKNELLKFNPRSIPAYENRKLDPYSLIDKIGEHENKDPLHYAKYILLKIKNNQEHEIGTHTYSHYNCFAEGQSIYEFDEDLNAAKSIARPLDIELESIVFPKNQVVKEYLDICAKNNITSYRGTENGILYNGKFGKINAKFPLFRLLRIIDAYVNLSGWNTHKLRLQKTKSGQIVNLPSSRFLRPYISKLSFLEPLKIKRITKAMEHAARNNELFHLWWHPHNFGANMDENFNNLEVIFKKFVSLREHHGFESNTMTELTNKLLNGSEK